ncbi:MAG: AAA family ATPase, partial [Deltaproteobacteria bacterium]|nr:AAA family ATPase [Deltaproteobacteria bacterium]
CGKTLLAYTLFSRLNPNVYQMALVAHPNMKPVELLRAVARALGAEGLPEKLSEMSSDHFHQVIENLLLNNIKDGKKNLVIIDEAHAITDPDVFEELRMLLNFQTAAGPMLTLFLMGQPELREKIQKNKQFLQRIPMAYHLEALKAEEVPAYITTRLEVAGAGRQIFTPEAVAVIAQNSGGIPRRINQICDLALMLGMHAGARLVEPPLVEEALRTAWGD